jgi:hypothetical protein
MMMFFSFWRRVDSSVDVNVSEKHTSTPKMETVRFSEPLESTDESKRRQNPEERRHPPHSRENLKSCYYSCFVSKEPSSNFDQETGYPR